ncbi:MAG TPA: DEAD/DEAH box helicase [Kofleriaceae bacterium]|nr:DEAD/DEAH box helicase [Kofleriaceae bacterium]
MTQLMPHQVEGVDFLLTRRAGLLAFEQGLGKTLVAIDGFRRLHQSGEAGRMLVICPNSLKRNWVAELARFAPTLTVQIAEGTPQKRRKVFAQTAAAVVITSYETARAEITAILALLARAPTALVLDESHAAKNWRSFTSTAARHFAPHSAWRWLLSGTPVTNSPADLFTQIDIVTAGKTPLGDMDAFVADMEEGTPSRRAELRERAGEFILRRTKEQCLDLPDKMFADVMVELPQWQRSLYDDVRDSIVAELRTMTGEQYKVFASTALVRLTRLAQLASNPALIAPTETRTPGKWAELDSILGDIMSVPGRKVILWSIYVETIEALAKRYAAHHPVTIYGAVEATERQAIAGRFQDDAETRLMIANPAAAGTGFTLTAAAFTIYESLSWRYDYYAQSQDRNHRIGQDKTVTYIRVIAADTIDEAMVEALRRKADMAADLLGDDGGAPRVVDLSRDQMCDLLLHNRMPSG